MSVRTAVLGQICDAHVSSCGARHSYMFRSCTGTFLAKKKGAKKKAARVYDENGDHVAFDYVPRHLCTLLFSVEVCSSGWPCRYERTLGCCTDVRLQCRMLARSPQFVRHHLFCLHWFVCCWHPFRRANNTLVSQASLVRREITSPQGSCTRIWNAIPSV